MEGYTSKEMIKAAAMVFAAAVIAYLVATGVLYVVS